MNKIQTRHNDKSQEMTFAQINDSKSVSGCLIAYIAKTLEMLTFPFKLNLSDKVTNNGSLDLALPFRGVHHLAEMFPWVCTMLTSF